MVAIPLNQIEIDDIVELIVPIRTPTVLYTAGHIFRVVEIINQHGYVVLEGGNLLYVLEDLHNPSLVTTVSLGFIVKLDDLQLVRNKVPPTLMLN